jgi:hypothetical protein
MNNCIYKFQQLYVQIKIESIKYPGWITKEDIRVQNQVKISFQAIYKIEEIIQESKTSMESIDL